MLYCITAASEEFGAAVLINSTLMKEELQAYLHGTFGNRVPFATNTINQHYSIGGQVHIRFELGDELPNGTKERVQQASRRAIMLFKETFTEPENEIWVLIYEYQDSFYGRTPGFLYQQFSPDSFAGFYNQLESVDNGELDEQGQEDKTEVEARIIIGKVKVKDIGFENILVAIANTEMGFEPSMDERIFFIDPQTDRIFHMYDDRGCLVESNSADNIRALYHKRNSWTVDYHRPEIDKHFQ